jgi:hypothetical protein
MGAHVRYASAPPVHRAGRLRICRWIRSAKAILKELKGLIELLVLIAVSIWGLWHVLQVLFVQAN